jgi:predicted HTH transcriptional regulator
MSSDIPNKTFIDPAARWSTDHLPVRGASPAVLDFEKVAAHIDLATKRGRYHGSDEPIEYLHESQCVTTVDGTTYATSAGILCFGRDPQAIFPRAVVDLGHYHGIEVDSNEVVHLEKNIGGTIFDQIERAETYLWTNTHHGMTLGDSARRIEIHEYPRAVIRELGVNMLVHRDYTRGGTAARVQQFRNRIEWISPGGLPPGITVYNILDEQWSRNPVILEVLYEAGYVEAFGQGLNTVVNELRGAGMAEPGFRDTGASFIVTVYGRTIEGLGNGEITARMSERQREIRSVIQKRGEVSSREIVALFANHVDARSIRRDLQALTKAGVIIMQGWGRSARYYWANGLQKPEDEDA